ncbi:DUF6764 family protein [Williamsia sp. CHRR-6]|uniref:DUF6764 family protein n=1 Tax=Williamsia sp. CHRR-6 TaxID=2835871 RepID=UPI001BDA406D|nr:DUF6764 family protein [Williamsia sp. CHRR-6]MBT0567853.1 hypothetical protein [Williamsia sp. CHRR-6]
MSSNTFRRIGGIAALTLAAGGGAALAAAPASAAPTAPNPAVCPALATQKVDLVNCSADSSPTGTSAGIGTNGGSGKASAGTNGLALGIGLNGGKATSTAKGYSAPAAIAVGPGATVTLQGIKPGLAIGIAGAGATVTIDGKNAATCSGGPSFAGDFQTFTGCINLGNGTILLGRR